MFLNAWKILKLFMWLKYNLPILKTRADYNCSIHIREMGEVAAL